MSTQHPNQLGSSTQDASKPPLGPRPDHILGKAYCQVRVEDAAQCRDEMTHIAAGLASIANRMRGEGRPAAEIESFDTNARLATELIHRLTVAIHEATRPAQGDKGLPPFPVPQRGERWRHFKGHEYTILALGLHSETKEPYVIYQAPQQPNELDPHEVWVRPLSMWHDSEPKMGGRRRFEQVPS